MIPNRQRSLKHSYQRISKAWYNSGNGQWQDEDYQQRCMRIREWGCQKLIIENNAVPNMIKSISHIHFPRLRFLFLENNLIDSIQNLSLLQFKSLQLLSLRSNHITIIKSLRKLSVPHLKQIFIDDNIVAESFFWLSELHAPQLVNLSVDYHNYNNPTFQDINVIVKLESRMIDQIEFDSSQRIFQNSFDVITKRFPNANISQQLLYAHRYQYYQDSQNSVVSERYQSKL